MFPFFGGKIPHPEKTKKGILSSPFLKLKYAFLCGLPRGEGKTAWRVGVTSKGQGRFPTVAFALAREGVHRSTCRGSPKKTGPEAEGCAPSVTAELGRFLGTKAHLFCKKAPNLVSSTVMFPAGGKQVGKGFFQSAIFVAESASCRRESTKHWQPTLVEMTRHLNILSFLRGVPRFAVRSHRLHPSKHKLRSQTSLTDLHVPPYKEDTRSGPLPIKT